MSVKPDHPHADFLRLMARAVRANAAPWAGDAPILEAGPAGRHYAWVLSVTPQREIRLSVLAGGAALVPMHTTRASESEARTLLEEVRDRIAQGEEVADLLR